MKKRITLQRDYKEGETIETDISQELSSLAQKVKEETAREIQLDFINLAKKYGSDTNVTKYMLDASERIQEKYLKEEQR